MCTNRAGSATIHVEMAVSPNPQRQLASLCASAFERVTAGPIFHFPAGGVQLVSQPIGLAPVLVLACSFALIRKRFHLFGYCFFAWRPLLQRKAEDTVELRDRRALLL